MTSLRILVATGCLWLWVVVAHAQSPDGDPASESSKSTRELYEQGVTYYNVAEYAKAIEAFRDAYLISKRPSLLFNIAQAYRKLGDCNKAVEFYQSYLREKPDADDRHDIESKMRECVPTPTQDPNAGSKNPPPVTKPDVRPPEDVALSFGQRHPVLRTSVSVTGAVLAVGGGVTYWQARSHYNEVKAICPCPKGQFSGWETATDVSYGLLIGGGAVLAGGIVWWLVDRNHEPPRAFVTPTPGGLALGGSF